VKRELPLRVQPIPGEALESWLATYATRMRCTWGELVDAVMPASDGGVVVLPRGRTLTAELLDNERDAIATATGISPRDLDAMTLAGRFGAPIIVVDPRTRRARTPWGRIYRQRYCAPCLAVEPGRYSLDWQLPWITTCVEHRCLLRDACPACGQFQRVAPHWFRRGTHPHPDRCRRLVVGDPRPSRCRELLSRASASEFDCVDSVMKAQQRLATLGR
jgi:hypothetical protein